MHYLSYIYIWILIIRIDLFECCHSRFSWKGMDGYSFRSLSFFPLLETPPPPPPNGCVFNHYITCHNSVRLTWTPARPPVKYDNRHSVVTGRRRVVTLLNVTSGLRSCDLSVGSCEVRSAEVVWTGVRDSVGMGGSPNKGSFYTPWLCRCFGAAVT